MSTNTQELPALDDLPYLTLPDGDRCYIGQVADLCKILEAHGEQIYYVMALETVEWKDAKNALQKADIPRIFKVTDNFVSRSIGYVPNADAFNLKVKMNSDVKFKLPKIPRQLQSDVDYFFRDIDSKYHSEAIVLLTYDPEIGGEDGWGFVVPTQSNTAAHCNYEPDSVVDLITSDSAMIVGSIHSHPGMSAYASGTDHADQADFDGLHITYGWLKNKNNGATEYYAEIQSQGNSFVVDINDVFAPAPAPLPPANLEELTARVSKATTQITHSTGSGSSSYGGHAGSYPGQGTAKLPASTSMKLESPVFPVDCPDPKENLIIGLIDPDTNKACPFCFVALVPDDISGRRCLACANHIGLTTDTLETIVNTKREGGFLFETVDPASNPSTPIVLWSTESDGTNRYEVVYTPAEGDSGKS